MALRRRARESARRARRDEDNHTRAFERSQKPSRSEARRGRRRARSRRVWLRNARGVTRVVARRHAAGPGGDHARGGTRASRARGPARHDDPRAREVPRRRGEREPRARGFRMDASHGRARGTRGLRRGHPPVSRSRRRRVRAGRGGVPRGRGRGRRRHRVLRVARARALRARDAVRAPDAVLRRRAGRKTKPRAGRRVRPGSLGVRHRRRRRRHRHRAPHARAWLRRDALRAIGRRRRLVAVRKRDVQSVRERDAESDEEPQPLRRAETPRLLAQILGPRAHGPVPFRVRRRVRVAAVHKSKPRRALCRAPR